MQAIILAAGESSRFWPLNKEHKSQIKILGKPLIYWTLKSLADNGVRNITIITRPNSSLLEEMSGAAGLNINLSFVVQEKSLGTGDAIFRAKDLIKGPFFVFWAHKIDAGTLVEEMLEKYKKEGAQAVLLGTDTDSPWDFGILKFNGERVIEIVENPKPGEEPSRIKLAGSCFLHSDFFNYYQSLSRHHEEDFIDALNLYIKEKETRLILSEKEITSLKYPWEIFKISRKKLDSIDFQNYISSEASIGKNVIINGSVYIEDGVVISDNTIINGPVYIGRDCRIGVNNVIRGPINLEREVITGAFTEIKNCVIQKGTHIHSGYFGDSIIGKDCRFGAGFTAANRRIDRKNIKSIVKGKEIDTGLSYFGTVIGDNTRFGVNCVTMPGALIGSESLVGPGTIVFENIEDNMTFYNEFKGVKKIRKDGFSDSSHIK